MAKTTYTPEFKSKLVLELLQGEKQLGELAAEHNLNPNMLRNWRKEFIENASRVFDESIREKEMKRKEQILESEKAELYKTIGQLTIERNFLRECGERYIGSDFKEKYRRQKG
jgi:transposase-like protein